MVEAAARVAHRVRGPGLAERAEVVHPEQRGFGRWARVDRVDRPGGEREVEVVVDEGRRAVEDPVPAVPSAALVAGDFFAAGSLSCFTLPTGVLISVPVFPIMDMTNP